VSTVESSSVPTLTRHERARGGLLGLAVADALGAPLEFAAPAQAAAAVEAGLEMTGGGGFGWLPGEWTDDTTMALCLAESIGAHGILDLDDVTQRCARRCCPSTTLSRRHESNAPAT